MDVSSLLSELDDAISDTISRRDKKSNLLYIRDKLLHSYSEMVRKAFVERLRGVELEHKDTVNLAYDVIRTWMENDDNKKIDDATWIKLFDVLRDVYQENAPVTKEKIEEVIDVNFKKPCVAAFSRIVT